MTETALVSRSEALTCEPEPFTSADFTPATSTPAPASFSSATPAYLSSATSSSGGGYSSLVSAEPAPFCGPGEPLSTTSTPNPLTSAPPARSTPAASSPGAPPRATSTGPPAVRPGAPGTTSSAADRPDSSGAATSGAGSRRDARAGAGRNDGGGTRSRREAAQDGEQRRQSDQRRMRLATPGSRLATGAVRLRDGPLFLAVPNRSFDAPRTLDVPFAMPASGQERSRRSSESEQQAKAAAARSTYAAAASDAEALFARMLAAAARVAQAATDQIGTLANRQEADLARTLARIDEDFAQRRLDAATRRDAARNHIASRTDLLRTYVIEQSNRALGRLAAMRTKIGEVVTPLRANTDAALASLGAARDAAYAEANNAHFAIQRVQLRPEPALRGEESLRSPEQPERYLAVIEAGVHYIQPRLADDDQALADRLGVVSGFVDPLLLCTRCDIDSKFQTLETHANNVGVIGPRSIRSARDGALKAIDAAEAQLELGADEAFAQTEAALATQHDEMRRALTGQAEASMVARRREVTAATSRQLDMLGGLAGAQPSALRMAYGEIVKAARAGSPQAADSAVQTARRIQRNIRGVAERHPASVLRSAENGLATRRERLEGNARDQSSMAANLDDQQRKLVQSGFDQFDRNTEETLIGMANLPGNVGSACDAMIRAAGNALKTGEAQLRTDIAYQITRLNDAKTGLIPPPQSTGHADRTEASHPPEPEALTCSAADAPNMSLFSPAPNMSMASPAGATASPTSTMTGSPAPDHSVSDASAAASMPASCGPCNDANAASAARATAASGGTATSPSSGAASTAAPNGDGANDVGVSSDQTNMRSPLDFADYCRGIARNPMTAPHVSGFVGMLTGAIAGKIRKQSDACRAALDAWGETDNGTMMREALRGLTRQQGRALSEHYRQNNHRELADDIRAHAHDSVATAWETDNYNANAALAALAGNATEAAINELRAAFNYSNEVPRIMEVMRSLTEAQRSAMVGDERVHAEMLRLMEQLDPAEQTEFRLLMEGNTTRVRSMALRSQIDEANRSHSWGGREADARGEALGSVFTEFENRREWTLENGDDRADIYELEDSGSRDARRQRQTAAIESDFANLDGVAEAIARTNPDAAVSRADDPPGAALIAYATRPLELYRVYAPPANGEGGEAAQAAAMARQNEMYGRSDLTLSDVRTDQHGHSYRMVTSSMSEYQRNWLTQVVTRGSTSREARAARTLAEFRRRGGVPPNLENLNAALHIGSADAREGGHFVRGSTLEAERERLEIFALAEQYRRNIEGGATGPIDGHDAQASFRRELETAGFRREEDRRVAVGIINSEEGDIQAVIDYAIARENSTLLTTYLNRMDSRQIETMVETWNRNHPNGPDLRSRLGVASQWSITNWNGGVFTGDESNALRIAMLGVPQNDLQRAEVQHLVVQQQIDQAGLLGRLLCNEEYSAMVQNARHLRESMGVTRADFDGLGRIRVIDPETGTPIRFNFDSQGNFVPAREGDVSTFETLLATSRLVADNYNQATDRMASFITTGIAIVAGAILSVCTLGIGTAVAVALIAGGMTILVNSSMRGGRYGRDDFTRDLVSMAVQALTAGIGAGVGQVARAAKAAEAAGKGAAAAFANGLSTSQRLLLSASRHPIILQGALGAVSSGISTAADPAMRRRDDYGDQVLGAIFRGGAGGVVTAGISHGITTGLSRVAQNQAVNRTMAAALARGASPEAAVRLAARAALVAQRSRAVEYGVRMLSGTAGATLGRGAELGFENLYGTGHHSAADIFREMRTAFVHAAIQNSIEAVGARYRRTSTAAGRAEDAIDRQLERRNAREMAEAAFEREMARAGVKESGATEASPAPAPTLPPHMSEAELADPPAIRAIGDEDGAPRPRTLEGANDNGPPAAAPVRMRADLAAGEMLRLGRVAEGSVFVHPDSQSLKAANDNFATLVNADPQREAAVYRNADTGEYIVIQGAATEVALIRSDGEIHGPGVTAYPASALAAPGGHWVLHSHFHPNMPGERGTRITRRLPSGNGGDFSVLQHEAEFIARFSRDGRAERTSRIYFHDNGQLRYTDFAVSIDNGRVTYSLTYPAESAGVILSERFSNMAEYHRYVSVVIGQDYPLNSHGRSGRAGVGAPDPLDPARRVGGERAGLDDALTAANRSDLALAASQLNQIRQGVGGTEPGLGRPPMLADVHSLVARMGLVDRPDSMRRLAVVLNAPDEELPRQVKIAILEAVEGATRRAMIARGELGPDEPLLLTLHGAGQKDAGSIRQDGFDLRFVGSGNHDDFGKASYFTRGLANALEYVTRRGGNGMVFPGFIRGREIGTVVDVSPGGAHRAEWEAFMRQNVELIQGEHRLHDPEQAQLFRQLGEEAYAANPTNAGRTPGFYEIETLGQRRFNETAPFEQLNRIGTRGIAFEAFLQHLAQARGVPALRHPDMVLGDLGGTFTSGIGRGDQQALRSQRLLDLINRQLGLGPNAAVEPPEALAIRAIGDEAPPARELQLADVPADIDAMVNRGIREFGPDGEAAPYRGTSEAERTSQRNLHATLPSEALTLVNATMRAMASRDDVWGAQYILLTELAPTAARRIFQEIAEASWQGRVRTQSSFDLEAVAGEAISRGYPRDAAIAAARALVRLHGPDSPLHQQLVEAPHGHDFATRLAGLLDEAWQARRDVRAARQFSDSDSPNVARQAMRRLLDTDTAGVVEAMRGDLSDVASALRFVARRIAAGANRAQAYAEGVALLRVLRNADFAATRNTWDTRLRAANLTHQDLADLVQRRPDALLHLARTSPQQLTEWFADYVLRQLPGGKTPVLDVDGFADYVRNRMISNALPVVSEASSVWSNLRRLGLQMLKADAISRGGANRPGLDIVGFSNARTRAARARGDVRVVIMDDKALTGTLLERVSAMTGRRLPTNLHATANEIETALNALVRTGDIHGNSALQEYVTGARAAVRQMRTAARQLEALGPPPGNLRENIPYLRMVRKILQRNGIEPVISSEYGNVSDLAGWLRTQGFQMDSEMARRDREFVRRLQRQQRRGSRLR